jgi:hypothetical protein
MTLILSLILALSSFPSWAEDFITRMAETYRETDRNYDLDCYFSYNKEWKLITTRSMTVKGPNTLSRSFDVDNGNKKVTLDFTLRMKDGKILYEALFDGRILASGKLARRDFYLPTLADRNFQNEFETNKIMCSVNFAYALPVPLEDGNYHINVHPHKIYDFQNRLKDPVEKYLNDDSYISMILLEAGNVRGNSVNIFDFFAGKDPGLVMPVYPSTLVNVPLSVPLIVSPAGNSRYEILAEREINVTFSGGNHNYCIWNSARHILENLLNSHSSAVVNFRYDMSAIVAQVRGVEGMRLNFPRRNVAKSNLLRDLLSDKTLQNGYHASYLYYFADYLANEYIGMYRTYTVDYEADGFKKTVTFQGKGTRDLKITFRYF